MTNQDHTTEPPKTYSAEAARQGSIVLRTKTQRAIFIAGLVGLVVLALFFAFLALDARDTAHGSLQQETPAIGQNSAAAN